MGLEDPIGKIVSLENTDFEIVGVTEDFHFASLHEEIKPLFFVLRPDWTRTVMAKIQAKKSLWTIFRIFMKGIVRAWISTTNF